MTSAPATRTIGPLPTQVKYTFPKSAKNKEDTSAFTDYFVQTGTLGLKRIQEGKEPVTIKNGDELTHTDQDRYAVVYYNQDVRTYYFPEILFTRVGTMSIEGKIPTSVSLEVLLFLNESEKVARVFLEAVFESREK